jgi:hypothetical protein
MGGGTEAPHPSSTAGMVPDENPTLTIKGAGSFFHFFIFSSSFFYFFLKKSHAHY